MSTPNASTRAERLLNRAKEAHEMVARLAADLQVGEGMLLAESARDDLYTLCSDLEGRKNAGQ